MLPAVPHVFLPALGCVFICTLFVSALPPTPVRFEFASYK